MNDVAIFTLASIVEQADEVLGSHMLSPLSHREKVILAAVANTISVIVGEILAIVVEGKARG